MKGWKETYTNIVLDEQLDRKSARLVKELSKAIDKTGNLIKQIPDDLEDSDSYQELSQGQNALEYGIRFLEEDLESLDEVKEEAEEVFEAKRLPQYGKTKFDGKEFNRKKEVKNIKNMLKELHKLAKMQDDFQYTAEIGYSSKGGNPNDVYKHLVEAEQSLYSYMNAVERGAYDGTIEVERD